MKVFILYVLTTMLSLQYANAQPSSRIRVPREVLHLSSLAISKPIDGKTEHDKLILFAFNELFDMAKFTVQKHKMFFKNIIADAKKSKINLSKELIEFENFKEQTNKLDELKGEQLYKEVFKLFEQTSAICDKYDSKEIENPTDEHKEMSKIFKDNNYTLLVLELLGNFAGMQNRLSNRVDEYIESLSPDEKRKEEKIVNWFNKFQAEKNFEKKVDVMMEFFELVDK